jgi:hypothetical protein
VAKVDVFGHDNGGIGLPWRAIEERIGAETRVTVLVMSEGRLSEAMIGSWLHLRRQSIEQILEGKLEIWLLSMELRSFSSSERCEHPKEGGS